VYQNSRTLVLVVILQIIPTKAWPQSRLSTAVETTAQAPVAIPSVLTPTVIDGLLSHLTDAEVRAVLRDDLERQAEEQAKANKLISDSLTPALLQLEQIKTQGKFNEALKVNRDAKIFLTPGGAVPNIWVDTKGQKTQRAISAQQ